MPTTRLEVASEMMVRTSGSFTTMIFHGCALHAEGDNRADSKIRSSLSFSTGWLIYTDTLTFKMQDRVNAS